MNSLDPRTLVESKLQELLREHGFSSTEALPLERPKDEKLGDLAFPCFTLAKALKKAPPLIARDLAVQLRARLPLDVIGDVQAVGPYLNFTFNKSSLAAQLLPAVLEGRYFEPAVKPNEKVMIEYSQPNTHKDFHVGHTRNASLGSSLVHIFRRAGFDVIAANYIGDVGAHIARCLWYLTKYHHGPIPEQNRGNFLEKMYIEGSRLLDFYRLTQAPHPNVVTAQVMKIENHPDEPKWKIVDVKFGSESKRVVTGATGFKQGDIVAYAKVGARIAGRDIAIQNKKGIPSDGMLCGEAEISMGEDANKVYVFSPPVATGLEVAEVLRKPGADTGGLPVVEVMQKRQTEVRKILKDMESGEPEITQLWRQTRQWSLDAFEEIYRWMDFQFDVVLYESDVGDAGKDLVRKAYKDGRLVMSDGAIGAKFDDSTLPFFILLKSDGTGLYSTKDLALAELKFTKYKIDRSIYVVDSAQSLHFRQVFATLKLLGFKNAEKCRHLAYARVDAKDGKMSSRDGNAIYFTQLRDEIQSRIYSEFMSKYEGEWPQPEIEETTKRLTIATIKYGMLNQDNNKNIAFDLEEWTARTGNTGPYLMYAFARIQSILREAGEFGTTADFSLLKHPSEESLLRLLAQFHETLARAVASCEPQNICIYAYDVAKEFSAFYTNCPVLKAPDLELRRSRLVLAKATGLVLQELLGLLGIKTVERM